MTLGAVGLAYLLLGFVLWVHAWADGATTHTLCGCGDPALFLWFFQWPATALAHGQNPFYSTALFHPTGVNLLSQTSVMGESLPLVPVTWIWGPVASLNVASTVTPALTAFFAFLVLRRWAPWTPAAFLGGLFYGFSPFVLASLEFAHLMTAALMLIPLVLAVLDEILIRQRHRAGPTGVALGLLLFGQFFLSSELLVVVVFVGAVGILAVVAVGHVSDPAEVRRRAPHAARALAVGMGTAVVLLAWPVWFALEGPAHLSGLVWPSIGIIGGLDFGSFVSPQIPHMGSDIYLALGGYEGAPLPSAGYLGWTLLAVLAGGLVVFRRDRRLWLFGFILALCAWCSLRTVYKHWTLVPAELFARLPLLENVIPQRFMTIGFLAAAIMLAVIVDRVHESVPGWTGVVGALAAAALALVPMATTFGPDLPFTMRPVLLPAWYTEVAPSLAPGRVLLSYPTPFSGIQSAMSWQAVNRINYSQAGGGGPQGVARRRRLGQGRVQRAGRPRLRGGRLGAAGDARPAGRRPPRTVGLAGQHRRDRHRHRRTQPPTRPGPHLRGRLLHRRPRPPAHHSGRGLGVGRRAAQSAASLADQARDAGLLRHRGRGLVGAGAGRPGRWPTASSGAPRTT